MARTALRRTYREAIRAHLARRPDPQDYLGQGLDGLDAYEAALDVWRTELIRREAALRAHAGRRDRDGERRETR
jgi:hypothetical protein